MSGDELEANQPINSPIRLTPERREGSSRSRRRPAQDSGTRVGDDEKKPRLPVRDRLYLTKTDIGSSSIFSNDCFCTAINFNNFFYSFGFTERKSESLNYRQHHKLSSNLARRLGPPSTRPRHKSVTFVIKNNVDKILFSCMYMYIQVRVHVCYLF